MAVPGPKPKPALAVVREGNPGHRPVSEGATLPADLLVEPTWSELLPGRSRPQQRARSTAAALWARLAPVLSASVGLVGAQQEVLVEYCITYARIEQGERALSMQGVLVESSRGGDVKNPWATVLNQYRRHLRALIGELGLSPSAASRLSGAAIDAYTDADDDDDGFDG